MDYIQPLTTLFGDIITTNYVLDLLSAIITNRKIITSNGPIIPYFLGTTDQIISWFSFLETNLSALCFNFNGKCPCSHQQNQPPLILLNTSDNIIMSKLEEYTHEYSIIMGGNSIVFPGENPTKIKYGDGTTWERLIIIKLVGTISSVIYPNFIQHLYEKSTSSDLIVPKHIIDTTLQVRISHFEYNTFIQNCCNIEGNVHISQLYEKYIKWMTEMYSNESCDGFIEFNKLMSNRFTIEDGQLYGLSLIDST